MFVNQELRCFETDVHACTDRGGAANSKNLNARSRRVNKHSSSTLKGTETGTSVQRQEKRLRVIFFRFGSLAPAVVGYLLASPQPNRSWRPLSS